MRKEIPILVLAIILLAITACTADKGKQNSESDILAFPKNIPEETSLKQDKERNKATAAKEEVIQQTNGAKQERTKAVLPERELTPLRIQDEFIPPLPPGEPAPSPASLVMPTSTPPITALAQSHTITPTPIPATAVMRRPAVTRAHSIAETQRAAIIPPPKTPTRKNALIRPTVNSTPTPTPTLIPPTPTPPPPQHGNLITHRTYGMPPAYGYAELEAANLEIEAHFTQDTIQSVNGITRTGFVLRKQENNREVRAYTQIQTILQKTGESARTKSWIISVTNPQGQEQILNQGLIPHLDHQPNATNSLRAVITGDYAALYLNNEYAGGASLEGFPEEPGQNAVFSQTWEEPGFGLYTMKYHNLQVQELYLQRQSPADGVLNSGSEERAAVRYAGVNAREIILTANFQYPADNSGNNYSYGFITGWDPQNPQGEMFLLDGRQRWHHLSRREEDERWRVQTIENIPQIELQTTNRLSLSIRGQKAYFTVNGKLVSEVELRPDAENGEAGTIAHAYRGHDGEIRYSHFQVWTPTLCE